MKVISLIDVPLQGIVRVVPPAKVVQLAPDLFRPAAGGVGVEGEVGLGLWGFALATRSGRLGHWNHLRGLEPSGGGGHPQVSIPDRCHFLMPYPSRRHNGRQCPIRKNINNNISRLLLMIWRSSSVG